ncbi:hypothetical protein [Flavobacterium aquidurense]|uniref:hypothetical protein n=1 Tax=Flavobacterium aquidurense TaxID=362413 RepID=UPI0028588685|nr:hypothetical protein [Flavobacterium aquidurense]MDR7370546.1 hypothetical protein [Flavobacterium aquidurense]
MNQELHSQFDEFEKPLIIRRKLLPWWIKTFCWIFMFMGICGIVTIPTSFFSDNVNLMLYGFSSNTALSGTGIFIILIMTFKAFAAYSLWFEKENAIMMGKIDAILGIVICIAAMFVIPFISQNSHFEFRLEILLLIPYYIKLNKIEYEWDNLESI